MSELRLAGLEKCYGATVAVAGIDLEVREGEFMTLLGPSGCGKTTTLGLIAGFFPPSAGEIYLKGQPVAGLPPFKRDIGVVFQDYALFPHMSAGENVAFGLRMRNIQTGEIDQRVREALDLVQLSGLAERRPLELSGGQRQRVALARALVIRPAVLLLDEPLSNLDLKLREEMRVEIAGLQRRLGITTVFVTHDQPAEIYERPATRFVAEFIGRMNFFSEANRLIAIRPERARLSAEKTGDFARRGKVGQVLYLGATLEYHLTLDGGERALVEAPNDGNAPRFAAGDAAWFTASRESCYEMPAR
ncbi:MAG: ABC transporter ATP-binding protein [Betaproteobacteria bacterium]|nr:MAG: ABC transporter ATP-binding protein [Betaproteobacteria bacterium]